MSSKFDKFLRVWYGPILILIVFIAFGIYTIQIYLNIGGSSDEARKLAAEAAITLLATFVGIFVPLQLNRNWDSEKDRRTLAFTLGLFWHELLYNEYLLKEILGNLKIEQLRI